MEQHASVVYVVEQGCRVTGCLQRSRCALGFGMTLAKNNLSPVNLIKRKKACAQVRKKTETKQDTDEVCC